MVNIRWQLTVGRVGSSDDSGAGQSVFVELIFFTGLDSSNQNAKQVTMTGNAQTGAGDINLLDFMIEQQDLKNYTKFRCLRNRDINGVYQNDRTYFVKNNKLCFYDEFLHLDQRLMLKFLNVLKLLR
nr:MAG: hypothetical protein CM15mV30_1470 [uncultured marine virus]